MERGSIDICCGPRVPEPEPDGFYERFLWRLRRSDDGEYVPVLLQITDFMLLISFLLILVALAPVLWPIAKIKALFSKNPEDTNEPDGVTNTQQVTYHPPSAEDVARAVEGLYNNPVTRK